MITIFDLLSPPGTHHVENSEFFDENGIARYLSAERRAELLETLPERKARFLAQKANAKETQEERK